MKYLLTLLFLLPHFARAQQEAKHWQTTIDFAQHDVRDDENPDFHLQLKNKVLVDLFYQSLKAPLFKDLFKFAPCLDNSSNWCIDTGLTDRALFRISLFATDLATGKMIGSQNELNFSTCNSLDNPTCTTSFRTSSSPQVKPDAGTQVSVDYSLSTPIKIPLKTGLPFTVVFAAGVKFRGERTFALQGEHAALINCAECTENKKELTTSHAENNFDYTLYLRSSDGSDQSDNHDHQGAIDCNDGKTKCEPLHLVNY